MRFAGVFIGVAVMGLSAFVYGEGLDRGQGNLNTLEGQSAQALPLQDVPMQELPLEDDPLMESPLEQHQIEHGVNTRQSPGALEQAPMEEIPTGEFPEN